MSLCSSVPYQTAEYLCKAPRSTDKKPHNLRIANTYVLLLHTMVKALQVLEHCFKAVLGH